MIYHEEQSLIKYYLTRHLTMLKIQNMIHIYVELPQCLINLTIKSLLLQGINSQNQQSAAKIYKLIIGIFWVLL